MTADNVTYVAFALSFAEGPAWRMNAILASVGAHHERGVQDDGRSTGKTSELISAVEFALDLLSADDAALGSTE